MTTMKTDIARRDRGKKKKVIRKKLPKGFLAKIVDTALEDLFKDGAFRGFVRRRNSKQG